MRAGTTEERGRANPAAPHHFRALYSGLSHHSRREIRAVKCHQITPVSTTQIIQTAERYPDSRAAELPPRNDTCKHVPSNFADLIAPHVGCAKPHSKKFHLMSHERPVQSIKAGDQDMLMLSLLQTKLMLFKPWSHQTPLLLQGLMLGEHWDPPRHMGISYFSDIKDEVLAHREAT